MLQVLNSENSCAFPGLIHQMHRDRKRLFVDTMKWSLPHENGVEIDQFDDEHAEYLVLQDPESGEHLASLRLLQTMRPHLMDTAFPDLCEDGIVRGPDIREITRLCLPIGRGAEVRIEARNTLAHALVDYALRHRISAFTCLCTKRFFLEVIEAGWRCKPLCFPTMMEGEAVIAFQIFIDEMTAGELDIFWPCHSAMATPGSFDVR